MSAVRVAVTTLGAALFALSGCNIVGSLMYFTLPPQVQKREFELTSGRLAVLVEMARPEQDNPVFAEAFHERLVEIFREQKKIRAQVIPYMDVVRLRQKHADFYKWSLPEIGRRLKADQVLYVRVESLELYTDPGSPVLAPQVRLRLAVVDPNAPAGTSRLWPPPEEREGRIIERGRHQRPVDSTTIVDSETRKLARDAAVLAAMPFYDVDLEEPVPWEK
jgi:hypothetical protein